MNGAVFYGIAGVLLLISLVKEILTSWEFITPTPHRVKNKILFHAL